jgi:2-polyprenyl-3-methyl-5-hydroxy-6-metoxy-1,4-benzoquinol methylase
MEKFTPEAYYDEYGDREWERLERGFYSRLEYEETRHYLDRELPESGHLLDVGGGAGRYSVELAQQGYDVTLVDQSSRQVELAAEKASEHGVADSMTAQTGDVRELGFAADTFDATLCLGGPLSHVLDVEERRQAATELRRVTTPGGPVFVSVMGRLAALQTISRMAGRAEGSDETELLPYLARTGDYDADLLEEFDLEPSSPPMHLFRVDELRRLLQRAGLTVHTLTGLESVVSQRRVKFDVLDDHHRAALRETVAALRGDPGVADLSGHMLAVATA